ncbi:hypothetical protein D9M69_570040 [compost metagenome]
MVPNCTPRARCERNLTHSKKRDGSSLSTPSAIMRCTSSQVVLTVSQTSVVSEPRTARAFSRAARRQLMIDDTLVMSRTMKSITSSRDSRPYLWSKACVSSEISSMAHQPCSATSADCGSSEVW